MTWRLERRWARLAPTPILEPELRVGSRRNTVYHIEASLLQSLSSIQRLGFHQTKATDTALQGGVGQEFSSEGDPSGSAVVTVSVTRRLGYPI